MEIRKEIKYTHVLSREYCIKHSVAIHYKMDTSTF